MNSKSIRAGAIGSALFVIVCVFFLSHTDAQPPMTFTVTTTTDNGDNIDPTPGSLRQAVINANANSGTDTIAFNIAGPGVQTINLQGALPAIADPVIIDGYTQPGASANTLATGNNAVLLIEIKSATGFFVDGLTITAGSSTVQGLVINRVMNAIVLSTTGGNTIQGNFIGTDAAGTSALSSTGTSGVRIQSGSNNNTIGGTTAQARNVISGLGNGSTLTVAGVLISGTNGNQAQGNYIGTDKNGAAQLKNDVGVRIISAATNNTIGGTAAGARNLISTNNVNILISDTGTSANQAQGNFIGTDAKGTTVLGLAAFGVRLANGASNNTIGGVAAGARNIIAVSGTGVDIQQTGTSNNQVLGNYIGVDVNGAAFALSGTGVSIRQGATNNTIGGATAAARNVISDYQSGVEIRDAGTTGNLVQGNFIGTDPTGTAPRPNSIVGVTVIDGANNNTIGGAAAGAGNTIAFNNGRGVVVDNDPFSGLPPTGVAILGNSIFSNAGVGIDLGSDAVTPNDPCDADTGANNIQNFPVITSAGITPTDITIVGMLNSTPNTTFRIEFFSNTACDLSGNGEGQTFIGSTTVTTAAGPGCSASFNVTFPVAVPAGQRITSTATDPAGNTSEFSSCSGPTAVEIIDFTATGYTDSVLLQWRTGFEVDNLGFRLYRDEGGKRTRLTPQLLAGSALVAGPGTILTAGRSYSWRERSSKSKGAWYWLEEIDTSGQSAWHGPVRAQESGFGEPSGSQAPNTDQGQAMMLSSLASDEESNNPSAPLEPGARLPKLTTARLAAQARIAAQRAVKLSVKQAGWYRVTAQELQAAGLDPNLDPRYLQLFVDGRELPIAVITDSEKQRDTGFAVEFYGIGLDSAYSDARVYWLVAGRRPGLRINTAHSRGVPAAEASFPFTVERKDKTIYFSALRNGEAENFFGSVITSAPADQSLAIQHLDQSSPAEALLEVALRGVTAAPHQVKVFINEVELGAISFAGQARGAAKFSFSHATLREGNNTVGLVAQGGDTDVSLVESIRLTYRRNFTAAGNALRLTIPAGQEVRVDGFSNPAIRLADVTDASAPQEISGEVRAESDGYSITAAAPGGGQRTLLAFAQDQVKRPAAIVADQPSSLRKADHAADLIIITRGDFFDSIEPLAALRRKQGLRVAIVDIEDVYDEFSFGHKTPYALKDFFAFAKSDWKTAPRYALLVGGASFDPKNYLGKGDRDWVPTKLLDTEFLETASDDWLVDFNGDGLAEISVGRLPVRTPEEAASLIAKIVTYEKANASDSVLLVADSNDGHNFEAANSELRSLIPDNLRVGQINRGRLDAETAKSRLIEAINRGQKVVSYAGHGSVDLWRGNLLTAADALELDNGDRLPLFIVMTCLNGYFHDAAIDSLAEALMKADRGGAVAVWASSGLTLPDRQALINQELYRLLFAKSSRRLSLGEATRRAKSAVSDTDIRRTWILFGDPTMKLR